MTENDPMDLADAREQEADELAQRSDRLAADVKDTREDWRRKRSDEKVPGAPPMTDIEDKRGEDPRKEIEENDDESMAAQAPPPSEGPGDAETPPEGATGEPADTVDEEENEGETEG